MAKTMKAAVVHEFGKPLKIEEVPIPTPQLGEVLIKVIANGVCHTDLHAAEGDWPAKPAPPFIPGHEGAGIVAAVGPEVTGLKEGDAVGLAWLHDCCGQCEYCRTGWDSLCLAQRNSGYSVNGSFAEYAIGSAAYVGRLPNNPDFAAMAPILCAGVTTYKGIKETEARPGEWIVISGVGGLGQLAIEYAKAMGLHVAAVDVTEREARACPRVGRRGDGEREVARCGGADCRTDRRRCTWCAGDGCVAVGFRSSDPHGAAQGHDRHSSACRLANSRRQFSMSFWVERRSAARLWAAARISLKRSSSLRKGRSIPTTTR